VSQLVWLLDRAAGLVALPALSLSVLTGIVYSADRFGPLYRAARRIHIEVAVFATIVMVVHGALGVLDAWFVVSGAAPAPAYSTSFLLAGTAVGVGGLFLLIVSVLGFLDARRFERPWGPRVVHAFAYGGYAFAVVHAVAVGTDVGSVVRSALLASTAFLAYVVVLRALADAGVLVPESAGA